MKVWLLFIFLQSTIGIGQERLVLTNARAPYPSLGECMAEGDRIANWLTQDFINVQWDCQPIEKEHDETHLLDPSVK